MQLQLESASKCLAESFPLQAAHWAETEGHRNAQMAIDYEERAFCDQRGKYVYATARTDEGLLVGHCGWFVRKSNMTGAGFGQEDMIFILPDYRGGSVADDLWKMAEAEVIARCGGVVDLRSSIPNSPALIRIWRRWGYTPTTINMTKTERT
jgi:GNAT superfamily N-acetyltransferase